MVFRQRRHCDVFHTEGCLGFSTSTSNRVEICPVLCYVCKLAISTKRTAGNIWTCKATSVSGC